MDTAERLIRSTRELLWERGYVGTSTKAIQQRAQAGQGSMYHHFSGKPDLALAAIQRSAEQVRAEAEAVLSGPGSPAARIAAYLRTGTGCSAWLPDRRAHPGSGRLRRRRVARAISGNLRPATREARGGDHGRQGARRVLARRAPPAVAATIAATVQGGYVLARAARAAEPAAAAIEHPHTLLQMEQTSAA